MSKLRKVGYITVNSNLTDEDEKAIAKLSDQRTKVFVLNSQYLDPARPPNFDSFEGHIPKGFTGPVGKTSKIQEADELKVEEKAEGAGGKAKQASVKSPAKGAPAKTAWKPN